MTRRMIIQGMILWGVMTTILSYVLVGSFNPVTVFSSDTSLPGKIIVGVMLLMSAGLLLQLLVVSSSMGQKICPICNKNLVKFIPVYGNPKNCWTCLRSTRTTTYHEKCFRAVGKCPVCEKDDLWSPLNGMSE